MGLADVVADGVADTATVVIDFFLKKKKKKKKRKKKKTPAMHSHGWHGCR